MGGGLLTVPHRELGDKTSCFLLANSLFLPYERLNVGFDVNVLLWALTLLNYSVQIWKIIQPVGTEDSKDIVHSLPVSEVSGNFKSFGC